MSFPFSPRADAHFHIKAQEVRSGNSLEEDLGYVTSGTVGHAIVTISEAGLTYELELQDS